jgi:outer membrane protein assembly factor BamB
VAPTPRGKRGVVFTIAVLGALGAGGVFGARFLIARSQEAGAIVSWVGTSPPCLIDVDGDDEPDVAGYGVTGGTSYLYAIDHETGAIRWRQKVEDGAYDPLFCEESAVLAYRQGDQTVRALDPASGERRWEIALSDKLRTIAFGEDCAVVTAIDGTTTPIDLSNGGKHDCKPKRPAQQPNARTELKTVRGDGFEATATGMGSGTPRLRVAATRAGKELWTADLEEIEAEAAMLTAVEGAVIVAGSDRKTRELVVTRLDAKTGKVEATSRATVEDIGETFAKMAANDATVFVQTFGMLHAFDAESLELRWYAGTMWGKKK